VQRRRAINKKTFLNISIPFPPLIEQKNIATVLSALQDTIAKTDALIESLYNFKKTLMRHLFTYGPVAMEETEQVRLKETEIGKMPEEWEVVKLENAIQNTQYGLSKRGEQEGQYPILRMNNMVNGRLDISDLQYTNLDATEFKKFRLNKGDILF
jgi:type I restriction enzyme S subunit